MGLPQYEPIGALFDFCPKPQLSLDQNPVPCPSEAVHQDWSASSAQELADCVAIDPWYAHKLHHHVVRVNLSYKDRYDVCEMRFELSV